ncbi:hypothetical protein D3C78_1552870 [compost metagenome]
MQVAIHLVGGNVVEAKRAFLRLGQGLPIGSSGFQQAVGADDIGLDEVRRAINGAVYMGLGRQMHDGVRLESRQHCTDGWLIDDIGLDEFVAAVVIDAAQ